MAATQKVLGQLAPLATADTDLYTVPAGKYAVCSTLFVCNRGIAGAVRVTVRVAGAVAHNKQALYYDVPVPANETLAVTCGITLAATDVVTVYASHANFSFNLFGTEADV
jgi:hypothetical protein